MDAFWTFPVIIGLIAFSIVGYRIAEGLLLMPQRAPRTDFEVLTDAVTEELERLHSELSNFSAADEGYQSIVNEIGRLSQKFVNLYDQTKPKGD